MLSERFKDLLKALNAIQLKYIFKNKYFCVFNELQKAITIQLFVVFFCIVAKLLLRQLLFNISRWASKKYADMPEHICTRSLQVPIVITSRHMLSSARRGALRAAAARRDVCSEININYPRAKKGYICIFFWLYVTSYRLNGLIDFDLRLRSVVRFVLYPVSIYITLHYITLFFFF